MSKTKRTYNGSLHYVPKHDIYLNITNLKDGKYVLHISHKNKIIKKTTFKK
ncbi:hypothetical protein [Aequorivita marina]|uniref:hypothetical protein n=1 Tax=Aequorivita marina TaxID=3073654 RepID=UPI00287537F6|nr:hypothetical protein [Aequorivita sp. S2608]MDS1298485.1 hypothetical protein [Aequorivita sp. S2608]